jgi:hypothetical protein
MTASALLLLALLAPASVALAARQGVAPELPEVGFAVGQAHPDLALPALDGGAGRLSELRGKRLLLFHFASW